jgi:hypothetical protein
MDEHTPEESDSLTVVPRSRHANVGLSREFQ